jgi:cytochrome c
MGRVARAKLETGGVRALAVALVILAAPALAQPAGDAARGKAAFEDRCTLCHGGEGQGPDLAGVVGRKAGTKPGASDALKASGITWTPASLDRFLANPTGAVPGTAMPVSVDDAGTRADIIAYLATLEP